MVKVKKGTPIPKKILKKLYTKEHQSMAEIAKSLTCSVHKITYWMDKYKIKRRNWSQASYHKHNPNGDPFNVKKNLTPAETHLKLLALGLYWGEGMKATNYAVKIGNTDTGIITTFRTYLTDICQVDKRKIKYYLQTFNDTNQQKAKDYWASRLHTYSHKILVSKPVPPQGKGNYKRLNKYGVLSLCFFNIKLKKYIMNELIKLGYCPQPKLNKPR